MSWGAVREEQVDMAVVVVVEELQAPAAQEPRGLRHAVRRGDIGEGLVPVVVIQGEHLLIDVRDEQILAAVAVEVRGVDAHPRSRRAVRAEADLRGQSDLVPLVFAAVDEEEVLHRIVRDEEVHQPVVVDVGRDHPEAFAQCALEVGARTDLGERPVAVVVKQQAWASA
jgi:hypothetical protein